MIMQQIIKYIISNASAIFGMAGTILIFKFGIPTINRGDENTFLVIGTENEKIKNKIKIYDILSYLGLIFLFISFFLQLKF